MIIEWLVFVGAGSGGLIRYWVSKSIYSVMGNYFPYSTLIVNTTGSFLMGLLFTLILNRFSSVELELRAFLLVGFLGGYTTFSSFSIETLILLKQGAWPNAILNIMLSVILCLLSVWLGIQIGRQV